MEQRMESEHRVSQYNRQQFFLGYTKMLTKVINRGLFSSLKQISDWQYVSSIHGSLKNDNINEAMRYLINSQLDGIVLDRQTFYNLYLKMNEAKVNLSYHELAYKFYRESFSPHILMTEWMKTLLDSTDQKIQELLTKDFQALNIPMPKIEVKTEIKNPQIKVETTPVPTGQSKGELWIEDKNNVPIWQLTPDQLRQVLKQKDMKIIIHDLEVEIRNNDQDSYKLQDFDQKIKDTDLQFQKMLSKSIELMSSNMMMKVGKVEVRLVKNKEDLKPDDNKNKP